MISFINNNALKLNYICKTPQVTYSIADFSGNVMKRGNYNSIENNQLPIEELPKGIYTLCIIDGDKLSKSRFQKS
ncbi:MAG: T9SS type A sorting domain-containing protein [Bacteroidia bacterium]